ncbi:hypothetical protein [Algoriphagus sediminis]|uniref:Uncharacterized protein n=1 Tax=Algoriphagus sediminis TaxID=3057113 RepID=A0ABT7YDJ8_9BACT|nr:hypothetical protein [Algoriphagus sediminis]MDN3204536.1 hypothetical protein [Algoriphagus sediminis]
MKSNLANHEDWIVLTQTIETLRNWAKKEPNLKAWILPHLERLSLDSRKAVSGKAKKMKDNLS